MNDIISPELWSNLSLGKYSRWVLNISKDSLESLFKSICIFSIEYNNARSTSGVFPTPQFARHRMAEGRMRHALEQLAIIQGFLGTEESFERRSPLSEKQGSAFKDEYKRYLEDADSSLNWAANLSENQLYLLLWQVGEYCIRVNSSRGEDSEDYPLPSFDVPLSSENTMRDALRTIAKIHNFITNLNSSPS